MRRRRRPLDGDRTLNFNGRKSFRNNDTLHALVQREGTWATAQDGYLELKLNARWIAISANGRSTATGSN